MITITYHRNIKMWHAVYKDMLGQLGQGFTAKNRDDAIFALGMQMGRCPERYSRPVGDYFSSPTNK
jgi:hypothetical protein